jgi:hypothetical protein
VDESVLPSPQEATVNATTATAASTTTASTTTATTTTAVRERLLKASPRPAFVQVPDMAFAQVSGAGDPNTSQAFADAIQALYSVSYTLRFGLKRETGLVYRVGPLEALWWADDSADLPLARKEDWHWTVLVAQPDEVTPEWFDRACREAGAKRDLPALDRIRLGRFEEGLAAQVLHVGPYATEEPTIVALHAFIAEHGCTFDGRLQKHHEIYLGDPRRCAPERLRTIIRQPVVGSPSSP